MIGNTTIQVIGLKERFSNNIYRGFLRMNADHCDQRKSATIRGLLLRSSLPLAFAGGWAEAATSAPALPQAFPFLGRHAFPPLIHSLLHAAAHIGTRPAKTMCAKKDAAQRQNSNSLPEGNLMPAEQHWQQPVPKAHYDLAADEDKKRYSQNCRRDDPQ
jgi:hypothetical protein